MTTTTAAETATVIEMEIPKPKKVKAKPKTKKKILLGKLKKTGEHKKPKAKKSKAVKPKAGKPKISKVKFDYKQLSADILAKREKDNLSFSDVEKSHGIARHIVFSIEAGKMVPSCVNFANIIAWLGKPSGTYFITVKKSK